MADPTPRDLGRRAADIHMAEAARRFLGEMAVSDRAHAQAGKPIPPETRAEIEAQRERFQELEQVFMRGGKR